MNSILKWPGGKEKELPIIRNNMPDYTGRYIEPFIGGGAVFFDIDNPNACINDKSVDLMNLYNCVKFKDKDFIKYIQLEYDEFRSIETLINDNQKDIMMLYLSKISIKDFISKYIDFFSSIATDYNDIFIKELNRNLSSKIKRSQKLENEKGSIPDSDRLDNIEAALKSSYYMYIRHLLNNSDTLSSGRKAAVFLFIREYCYSSMFRYNNRGEFNVPYGGISYNRKDFQKKIDYILSDEMAKKLSNVQISNDDFESFINSLSLTNNDFVFLDPPYDSDFSTYAQNEFNANDQSRLCECLKKTKAKIMLVIKNTDYIYNLYKNDFKISSFDKTYLVSFMNRNDKDVKHLVITNY
ncbi:DNA adenine methylase [Ruminococcus sp.]|uniref:DNA adenine methylase n=1 Tax=Ruminococcus sp. TaxID=41978 RepID=UPI0025FF6ADC|nr:DNA adenine methylase [Ruminococcus sp.]